MEKGFFHPESGYWQTICEPSETIIASYPEGTAEIPLKPGQGYTWDGQQWQEPQATTVAPVAPVEPVAPAAPVAPPAPPAPPEPVQQAEDTTTPSQ